MPWRRSSSSTSSGLTPRVSQIHLNYESMENQLRMTQEVLAAEQEEHRETHESVNAFNAQIQAFMAVVQCILDPGDIPIPTWQPPSLRSRPIPQWSPWPSLGSSAAQVSYNLAKLSQT
jgi:hypothetical protein